MITHRHFTASKLFETVTGVVLLTLAAAMRLAPAGIRDESGEAYIMIAILLIIGCWSLFDSLFK